MGQTKFATPERVDKPWGYELIWAKTDRYAGKILHIRAGGVLSYQYHRFKDETIYLLSGSVEIELGGDGGRVTSAMHPGEALHITPGTKHRIRALEESEVLEASTAGLDDVVHIEDIYGRA